ncbi:MAG: hypothetical protein ABJN69_05985 [Hellea sp.]
MRHGGSVADDVGDGNGELGLPWLFPKRGICSVSLIAYSLVLDRANRDNAREWYGHFTAQFVTKDDGSVSVEAVTCVTVI